MSTAKGQMAKYKNINGEGTNGDVKKATKANIDVNRQKMTMSVSRAKMGTPTARVTMRTTGKTKLTMSKWRHQQRR